MLLADKQLELNSDGDVFSRGFKSEVAIENTEIQVSGNTSFYI